MKKLHKSISVFVLLALSLVTTNALAAPGDTTRVSVDSSGSQGDGSSYSASISSDGRYVAFQSSASNLVAGDTNRSSDIFVHDRTTGDTTRVSVDSSGVQGNSSSILPSISSDGRYVAFYSVASNLVPGDLNWWDWDVFVHDSTTAVTTRIAQGVGSTQGWYFWFSSPSISSDGRYVAYQAYDRYIVPGGRRVVRILVHDRITGITLGIGGYGYSSSPSISSDGRYVALFFNAYGGVSEDVFVHDRTTGGITRVSVDSSGAQGNGASSSPSISSDGRYVAFYSNASNLVSGDTNGVGDVFVHDRSLGATMLVSVDSLGMEGDGRSFHSSISFDGRYVAFDSDASNLVSGDTNGVWDVFVHELDFTAQPPGGGDSILPRTGFAPKYGHASSVTTCGTGVRPNE